MTSIQALLLSGAEELRRFQRTPSAHACDAVWLNRLADRIAIASSLAPDNVRSEVHAITRTFIDSGPIDERAAPSFWAVVEALQHS